MKWWRDERKTKKGKRKKRHEDYTVWDFIFEALTWIPELVLLPFRILIWLVRGMGKLIENLLDGISF